jgi:cell division inhibitor SepF
MGLLENFKDKIKTEMPQENGVFEEVETDRDSDERESAERDSLDERRAAKPNVKPSTYESPYEGESTTVVRKTRSPDVKRASQAAGTQVRSLPRTQPRVAAMAPGETLVHNARPTSFNDCGLIADRFKGRQPVIIDLTAIRPSEQQRFLDFVAGLTYGLNGEISKISTGVYLITPQGAHVADADRVRFSSRFR